MRSPAKALRKNHVVIVDDHPLVREALMQLIDRQPDLNLYWNGGDNCGSAANGRDVVARSTHIRSAS